MRNNIYISNILIIFSLLVLSHSSAGAPQYIPIEPMADLVRNPVGEVKAGTKTLPLITWGGDIATIHGNGNALTTQEGSIFDKAGLQYNLKREDIFIKQVEAYLAGETPFLRGTLGMITSASDILNRDPRTKPVVFYQMTWSVGGDALVVKDSIKTAKDLKGKTIALQAYGPHVDYLVRLLADAGLTHKDVTLKWLPDLTASDNSPAAALAEPDIDAAFVIIPDALALTSDGTVGTGIEGSGSVKGAKILLSTKTANRVIADVYAVRNDYYQANRGEIDSLAAALIKSQDSLSDVVKARDSQSAIYGEVMSNSAEILLDSKSAIADVEGLYLDCEYVGALGNVQFFQSTTYPRRFSKIFSETVDSLLAMNLISDGDALFTSTDYKQLAGATDESEVSARFDRARISNLITRRQQEGSLSDNEIFSFEVYFEPNQNNFPSYQYVEEFNRALEFASTYGGALITIEGHSDPMGYLRAKKSKSSPMELSRIKQSAKNLSISRASEVRQEIIRLAQSRGVALDKSQFEPIGLGISRPKTGVCGKDPCAPASEQEWRSNMRVVFRLIQIESEVDAFLPL